MIALKDGFNVECRTLDNFRRILVKKFVLNFHDEQY